jgi:hypothetical protein
MGDSARGRATRSIAEQAPHVGQADHAEHDGNARMEGAVGEHRGSGRGDRHAVEDEHADQAALGASGDRHDRTAMAKRVGEHQQTDGQPRRADGVKGGGQGGHVEGEVSDRARDDQAVTGAQQLGARSDAVA